MINKKIGEFIRENFPNASSVTIDYNKGDIYIKTQYNSDNKKEDKGAIGFGN